VKREITILVSCQRSKADVLILLFLLYTEFNASMILDTLKANFRINDIKSLLNEDTQEEREDDAKSKAPQSLATRIKRKKSRKEKWIAMKKVKSEILIIQTPHCQSGQE